MGSEEGKKRQVAPVLRMLLTLDVAFTDKFCNILNSAVPQLSRKHHKALEISCHGLPWFVCWGAFILFFNDPSLYQIQINFLLGLIFDIIVIAFIKAFVRRRRPSNNEPDMFLVIGPDKFSFPSGHASRASFVAHFFISVLDLSSTAALPLLLWSAAVCVSRILLRRHHLVDVISGAVLGIVENMLVHYFWFNQDSCLWLLSILTS